MTASGPAAPTPINRGTLIRLDRIEQPAYHCHGANTSELYNLNVERYIYKTKDEMAAAAATEAAETIIEAIGSKGQANIILATGTSQIDMLINLTAAAGIDWSKVTMFHLDEYIGLGPQHPASFRKYLKERFVDPAAHGPTLPAGLRRARSSRRQGLKAVHFIDGDAKDPARECRRIGAIIAKHPIDVALVGIGENGHLAFNDPPADFDTDEAFVIVELDERCRKQQLGEGWFGTLEQVPRRAISMSIRQIMKSRCIIVTVPQERKAEAVRNALQGNVTPVCPASILQTHKNCKIFLDEDAASLLSHEA